MGEFWKVVVPIAGGLVVGVLLHLLKEGGVRRMRRRNLTEELKLLELLEEHPTVAARIRRRVEVALEQYEPSTLVRRQKRLNRVISAGSLFLSIVLAFLTIALLDISVDEPWRLFAVSVSGAVFANVLESWLTRRLQLREQDDAVQEVTAAMTGEGTLTADVQVVETPEDRP
jgi:hypothetical protein